MKIELKIHLLRILLFCLNPYCNGMKIEYLNPFRYETDESRLNPYCNGMKIELSIHLNFS